MGSLAKWFKDLSAGSKVAVIAAGLVGTGVFASAGHPSTPKTPSPSATNAAQTLGAETKRAPVVTTEMVSETEAIPFGRKTQNDAALASGTIKITTVGVDGINTKTYKVTKSDGNETKKEFVKVEMTTAPVDEVTTIGTYIAPAPKPAPAPQASHCNPNYSPCIPNVAYDLDCADIGFTVNVIGVDVYRLDRDKDGLGCE